MKPPDFADFEEALSDARAQLRNREWSDVVESLRLARVLCRGYTQRYPQVGVTLLVEIKLVERQLRHALMAEGQGAIIVLNGWLRRSVRLAPDSHAVDYYRYWRAVLRKIMTQRALKKPRGNN